jgi:hypothetical protein
MADYAAVQAKLNALGANPQLKVDGQNGPMTTAAVKAFQNAKGLVPDGIVGPMTLAALGLSGSATSTPIPSSAPLPTTSNVPPGELPNKSTPLTAEQAVKAISDGYLIATGKRPTPVILALLTGQSALETGNWGSGIHNYNFGNKKWSSGDKNWQFFRCSEIVDGKEVFYDPPHPACKFAAYGTAADGAAAYIRLLQSRPHWWSGLQSGTVDGFIQGLTTAPKYFTANPVTYRNVLGERMANYTTLAAKYAASAASGIGKTIAVVAVGILGFYFFKRFA